VATTPTCAHRVTADLVLTGGTVLTIDRSHQRTEAVAVRDGRIAFVGAAREAHAWIGPGTQVIELEGQTVLPGFQDAHLHVATSGMSGLQCDLREASGPEEYAGLIRAYAAARPDAGWIVGDGWSADDFGGTWPTRQQLDAIASDRPVYLETRDGHSAWLNTKALDLAGFTSSRPDPAGGVIDRDITGTPTGSVHENARHPVLALLPDPSPKEWEEAILRSQSLLHSYGITMCQEADLKPHLFERYRALAARGELTMRLEGNLSWSDTRGADQLDDLLEQRAQGTVGRMRLRGAKLFQDGVAENFTAAMLEPYRAADGTATDNAGLSLFDPERLKRDVTLLDANGFQVHIHALGDRAVRECLDAFEAAMAANGPRDARHHLAHVQFAHADDIARFAPLGVVANVTPLWAVHSGYVEELTIPFVSSRAAATMYPFGSLVRAGARIAFGSDWAVSSPDPLLQLAVAVGRRLPEDRDSEPFLPDECLDAETALHAATLGSAYVNHRETDTGSIEVGKLADLAVLDRDVELTDASAIADARVLLTLIEGDVVYRSADAAL
jgi:predicted amidohydrolase YtcJ